MVNDALVSVVIPVYKVEKYLEGCVESVLAQTYKKIEIILVDDGSPDKSPEICDRYAEKYDNISVIHKKNGGLSDARNHGIEKTNGEFIVFLDSDDTLVPDAVEELTKRIISTESDAVYPDRYYKIFEGDDKSQLCFHFEKDAYNTSPVDFAVDVLIEKGRAWRAHSLIYRTSVIKENSVIFPVGYTSEDFKFNLDFLSFAKKIDFLDKPTVNYLKRKGSITTTFDDKFINTIYFIDDTARAFLKKTGRDLENDMFKADSLYCRNIVTYLVSLMSADNMIYKQKKEFAYGFLDCEKTKKAFSGKISLPYFTSGKTVEFYKVEYGLIKKDMFSLAIKTADITAKMKR